MKYDTPIWHRIEELRAARGLTVDELAHASGVSRRHIYNIGSREREPGIDILVRLSRALGVPLLDLLHHAYDIRVEVPAQPREVGADVLDQPRLGAKTGLERVDRLISHIGPGDVVLLHGEAGSGKTALALQWVAAVAQSTADDTSAVVFARPTKSPTDIPWRLYPMLRNDENRLPVKVWLLDGLSREDMLAREEELSTVNFFLDCPSGLTRSHVVRQLGFLSRHANPSLAVFDPVDPLLSTSGIGELLVWLKRKAGVYGCVVLAVLNGRLVRRRDTRLKRSPSWNGRLGGADVILNLHRAGEPGDEVQRLVAEDPKGISHFTDLRLDEEHGTLRE